MQRDARWFRAPRAERVGLTSRHLARRLLLALVEARIATPGAAVSQAALYDAGWPGERMHPASARNRLHVAMSTLRKHGLDAVIQSEGDGYRLDPDVVLKVVD